MLRDAFGRPLHNLRISVTDRCNFRCRFCMPAHLKYTFLPRPELLTFEEITRLVRIFTRLGVRKVRLTGGEPLLRRDVHKLVAMLSAVEGLEDLAMTTNGFLLEQMAEDLKRSGLKRITVSLHSLDDAVFGRMNGRGFGTERVLEGILRALEVGLRPVKVNVVVQRGVNDHTIVDLARFFKDLGCVVRFIEYMDVGTLNRWNMAQVVPADEIVSRIHAQMPLEPLPRSYGDTALRFRYRDGGGEIGVIASVTRPFCGDCDRARLSAEGRVYTCLFASRGFDVKSLLRSGADDETLEQALMEVWRVRTDRYSEERSRGIARGPRIEMYAIGG